MIRCYKKYTTNTLIFLRKLNKESNYEEYLGVDPDKPKYITGRDSTHPIYHVSEIWGLPKQAAWIEISEREFEELKDNG